MTPAKGVAYAVVAVGVLSSTPSSATVIFHNTGTASGWSLGLNQEHNGTITQVTNVVYAGSTAIKARQIYDPGYTGRYHSEGRQANVYNRGDMGFYGFAFRLQADWQFQSQKYVISQFIANFGNTGCDDYIPTTMVWITGTGLGTRRKYGNVGTSPNCGTTSTTNYNNIATVSAGVWHRVEMQVNWKSDTTGYMKLWYDGTKVLEQFNVQTTLADDRQFEMRAGIYASGWYDDGYMMGTQGDRSIWIDQVGAGTTFAEADPNGW